MWLTCKKFLGDQHGPICLSSEWGSSFLAENRTKAIVSRNRSEEAYGFGGSNAYLLHQHSKATK